MTTWKRTGWRTSRRRTPLARVAAATPALAILVAASGSCDPDSADPTPTLAPFTSAVYEVPTLPTTPPPDAAFVNDCVEHVMFLAYTGDTAARLRWNRLEQSEQALREDCERIATDPDEQQAQQAEIDRLEAFLVAAEAESEDGDDSDDEDDDDSG